MFTTAFLAMMLCILVIAFAGFIVGHLFGKSTGYDDGYRDGVYHALEPLPYNQRMDQFNQIMRKAAMERADVQARSRS